jgi:DNA-binding CsgD family transcriptional regulator
MDPGDTLLFLGSTLHGAKSNGTSAPCAGMNATYSVGWLKPLEKHWLAYTPQVAQTFSAQLAGLIGYPQRRPKRGPDEAPAQALLPDDMPGYHLVDDTPYPASDRAADAAAPQAVGENAAKSVVAGLRAAFELTNSEAVVGQLLLIGAHARQISRLRVVSIETVRSQIKSVYAKAGVKSHPEFILKNQALQPALSGAGVHSAQLDVMPASRLRG